MKKYIILLFALASIQKSYSQGNNNGTIDGIEEMVERKEFMVPMPGWSKASNRCLCPYFTR